MSKNYPDIEAAFNATIKSLAIDSYEQTFTDEELYGFLEGECIIPVNADIPDEVAEAYLFGSRLAIRARQFLGFTEQKDTDVTSKFSGDGA